MKQEEKLRAKIDKIRTALAADKKRWGGFYDDSRGLRYLPLALFIKLGDYSGGLRYLNWFNKNFPDDAGFPEFLFEWTIILFKTGRLKEAEKKAFKTYCSNVYLFDKFFGNPIIQIDKYESSNSEEPSFLELFEYSHSQTELKDFSEWLKQFLQNEIFVKASSKYIQIYKLLNTENDLDKRRLLIRQADSLSDEF